MAYLGKSPSQGVRNRYYFTASGGETSISGALTGGTLTFTDGNYVDVNLNGVTLVAGTDYNTSTANTIAGLSALTASDVVEIVVYDVFSVFSGNVNSDFSVGGNLSVTGTTAFTGATTITGLTTTGDINFGDNDKAIFGAGSDLQIYHSGSHSYIQDVGQGNLTITAANFYLNNGADTENMISAVNDGAVSIAYNGATKLATTATGVSVTGQIDVNSAARIDSSGIVKAANGTAAAPTHAFLNDPDNGMFRPTTNTVGFSTAGTERMRLDSSGNLLIGKTADNVATVGIEARATGPLISTRDGADALRLNRLNSDGEIIQLRKDGTSVGAISTVSSDLTIQSTTSGHKGLRFFSGAIVPVDNSGVTDHANCDFGQASISFKNFYGIQYMGAGGHTGYMHFTGSHDIRFVTNGNERARFDASGNLLLGQSSQSVPGLGNTTVGHSIRPNGDIFSSCNAGEALYLNRSTNDGGIVSIRRQGTQVGVISVTTSGTTYNTTSDRRLKQDIEPLAATDKLMAMNPVSYNWKADPDGPRSMGFIAQQMADVMPEAVSTGDDDMMSMDYGRITPILVSALQDAHRKIEQLESRLAALET